MNLSALVAIPVAGGLLTALAAPALGATETTWLAAQLVAQGLAGAGCSAAAAALDRSDWMFRAWALYAAAFWMQVAWRLVTGPENAPWLTPSPDVQAVYLLVLNGAAIVGSVLFVRAFGLAGLEFQGSRARAALELALLALVGLGLGVPALLLALRDATGAAGVVVALAWVLGDVACFVLVAPLWRISRTFAGGALAWPWAFLAVGNLGYLLYDAAIALGAERGLQGPASPVRAATEAVYAAGALCALAAGLAHRRAVLLTRAAERRAG